VFDAYGALPRDTGEKRLSTIAHRVVRTLGSELITRGDALPDKDPPLLASEALGVVAEIIRDGSPPVPARPPSLAQRVAAVAIRRSEAVYRLMLRWRSAHTRLESIYRANDQMMDE
jgi:hypothetical protein